MSYGEKLSPVFNNLNEAVKEAYQLAFQIKNKAVYILFSPGATSFAMFNNEFHRGAEFNKIVKKLI
jgi:UDP-N-acetylmuramoylalanine--D-glutamate ligase